MLDMIVEGHSYKITITDLDDSRQSGGPFTIKYYVVPRVDCNVIDEKIRNDLNILCNRALKSYNRFSKEKYE